MTKKEKDPFAPWYAGNFLNGILALESAEEIAVYTVALNLIYDAGASIPNNEAPVAARALVTRPKARRILDKLLKMPGKLYLDEEGRIHNKRAKKWMESREKRSIAAAQSVRARWDSEKENEAKSTPEGIRPYDDRNSSVILNQNHNQNHIASSSRATTFDEVDAALRKIPGIEKHPVAVAPVIAPIWQLVEQGYDLTKTILPSISQQLRTANAKQRVIKAWSYFVPGIVEEAAQQAASTKPAPPPQDAKALDWTKFTRRDYENAIFSAKRSGEWFDNFGPVEKIPKDLIDYDLQRLIAKKRKA